MSMRITSFLGKKTNPHNLQRELHDCLDAYPKGIKVNNENRKKINQAIQFASNAHKGQLRKSGEEYVCHPISVAIILAKSHADAHAVMASILHDVVEDTPVLIEEIEAKFGAEVASLVDGVSKIKAKTIGSSSGEETLRKILTASNRDPRVMMIKVADRIHNMMTLDAHRKEKQQRIALQTLQIYVPIARRMGLYRWAAHLGDLVLQKRYPNRYKLIKSKLDDFCKKHQSRANEICYAIGESLEQQGVKARVDLRNRNFYGVYQRIHHDGFQLKIENGLREMRDVFVVNVIVADPSSCYQALGVVHARYKPISGGFFDYIADPKENGYRALHTEVASSVSGGFFEIQIRSEEMHSFAINGGIHTWGWQDVGPQTQWIDDVLTSGPSADQTGDTGLASSVQSDLTYEKIKIYGHKGVVKTLPKGASVLDFAYALSDKAGNHCVGGVINNRATVPSNYLLGNAVKVEVLCSNAHQPTEQFLGWVCTSRARNKIKEFLSKQKEKDAKKFGLKILRQSLSAQGYKKAYIPEQKKKTILKQQELSSWKELVIDIGLGRRSGPLIAANIIEESSKEVAVLQKNEVTVMIQGTEGMAVSYSTCCYPIVGDKIMGIIKKNGGLEVHRNDCKALAVATVNKFFSIQWAEGSSKKCEARLKTVGKDVPGFVASVATKIAQAGSTLTDVKLESRGLNVATFTVIFETDGRRHLANIIREIKEVDSVHQVKRV